MEKRHTSFQLLLQCDIASASRIDSWKPPLTSTPIHSKHFQIRKQSCSFYKVDHVQPMRLTNHIKPPSRNDASSLDLHNQKNDISIKSNQLVKSRNKSMRATRFHSSDSSSDEDDCHPVDNKKLIIKLNADKSNKVAASENQVNSNGNALKKKRGLKANNVNSSKAKISVNKQDEVKKSSRIRKQKGVKDVSSLDKENVIENVESVKSRLPIKKKLPKASSTSSTASSEKSQKRKGDKSIIKNSKKLKVIDSEVIANRLEELSPGIDEEKNASQLENEEEIVKEHIDEIPEVLRTEEKFEALEKSRNSSQHQIFSEMKEQEFLESLDLTTVEMEDPVKLESKSPTKKRVKKLIPATKKEKVNCSVMSDRPVRSRKPPKEFWLPPTDSEKPSSNMVGTSSDNSEKNPVPTSTTTSSRLAQCDKEKISSSTSNNVKCNVGEEFEPRCFTSLEDLEFKKNSAGYESAECCSLPNFKSGVVRIKSGAQAASKTKRKNSAFGGVLMKGSAKMKIGDTEKDIKEGEVIFVPPLSEWVISNTSEEETVMYYWCGQF